MNKLLCSSILLVAITYCHATSPDNAPADPKPQDSSSAELSRKTVRATSGTINPGSNNIPFHLNSLSSNQDGQSKLHPGVLIQNTINNQAQSNQITHANGQPAAPPPHSHHHLEQFVRAYATLPKNKNYQPNVPAHSVANIEHSSHPHGTIYAPAGPSGQRGPVVTVPPGATSANGGYILSVNTETGQTITSSGPTPVIMQYLPQSQQPTSGIQYLQLIPTRPLIVPISPFMTPYQHQPNSHQTQQTQKSQPLQYQPQQFYQQSPHQSAQYPPINSAQPTQYLSAATRPSASSEIVSSPYPYANYAAAQSYLTAGQNFQSNQPQPPSTAQYPVYHSVSGGGSYAAAASSSAPVVSMFRPHTGIQLINAPLDMTLNTNEYLPAQNENGYKMRRA